MTLESDMFAANSDEEYVVLRAKQYLNTDIPAAKAWMMTAKSLFPDHFGVQFEAYNLQKTVMNAQEAARCFSEVYRRFQDKKELWQEIDVITYSLRYVNSEVPMLSEFFRDMFSYITPDIQQQILVVTANRTQDTLEHCRVMLLLLQRFPELVNRYGPHLIDTLMTAEKHTQYSNSMNCYRKLLVCDMLPLLIHSSVVFNSKVLFRLLNKTIDFCLLYLVSPIKEIQDLPDTENKLIDPWINLFLVLEIIGGKLKWELAITFSLPWNKEVYWQSIVNTNKRQQAVPEEQRNYKELLYCTTVFFLRCLYEYLSCVEPGAGGTVPLLLVEAFTTQMMNNIDKNKRRKLELEDACLPLVTVSNLPGMTGVISNFLLGVSCWELLHSMPALEREFTKLNQHLKLAAMLKNFLFDVALYRESFRDTLTPLQTPISTSPIDELRRNLRLASVYRCQKNTVTSVEYILTVVGTLPVHSGELVSNMLIQPTYRKRHLHYLPLTRPYVLQYCVKFVMAALEKHIFPQTVVPNVDVDLAMGHLLTLVQFDWPAEEILANRVFDKIRQQRSFTYKQFCNYIITADLLEEFMFIVLDRGGSVNLDIIASPQANSTQRRVTTRGADKVNKEDFKAAMKKQITRSREPVDILIIKFFVSEKDSILQSFNSFITSTSH